MKENRSYSEELKAEAVKMVNEQGLSREEAAKQLMIPKGTIGNWLAAARTNRHSRLQRRIDPRLIAVLRYHGHRRSEKGSRSAARGGGARC